MVIISSFYNEEYLLPWWLAHHKNLFEHGVLFNYFSTDKSVAIIKKTCPTWEVRDTRNKDWDPRSNDEEFMDAERKFSGYKMTLTTTEFLAGDVPPLSENPTAYSIPIVRMVDTKPNEVPSYKRPLLEQKRVGYLDRSFRKRFLHNHPDGAYATGRDTTSHKTTRLPMWIYKYTFSPWTNEIKERRLQMKDFMSDDHLKAGWGKQHKFDKQGLDEVYSKLLKEKGLKEWN